MLFHVPCLGPRGSRSSSLLLSSLPSWLHPVRDLWALPCLVAAALHLGDSQVESGVPRYSLDEH